MKVVDEVVGQLLTFEKPQPRKPVIVKVKDKKLNYDTRDIIINIAFINIVNGARNNYKGFIQYN